MQNKYETFGDVVKESRQRAGMTIETLAEKVNVSERYIYRIENEGKKPSFDVLYKLIRELDINPDLIFFPEKEVRATETDELIRMLSRCDGRSMAIVRATLRAALESQNEDM